MLRANTDLCGASGLVTVSNQLAYTGTDRVPELDVRPEGRQPMMRLVATGLLPHLQQTTSSSKLTMRWEVQVESGSELFATIMDIEWEVYRALEDWDTYLSALQWAGEPFATVNRPLVNKVTLDDRQKGWTSVWTGETELNFTTSAIALGT